MKPASLMGYRQATGLDALGFDWTVPLSFAGTPQADGAVQGNFDPMRCVAGGQARREGVDAILRSLGGGPMIFNLGHGITPQTPIAHVEAMIARVRNATG